jgi:hypothetical protein
MPRLQEVVLILFDDTPNAPQFHAPEPSARMKAKRVKPELGDIVVTLPVNVWRFVAVTRIEKEPIWPNSKHCRHQ